MGFISLTFYMFCKTHLLNKKIPSRFVKGSVYIERVLPF
ncbi:hypothetical protein BCAH1134_C0640 (plasmid) [Bacillus cereus AH1134]|nr:hypothetical protein BCAH1134_C0640 [Bacillus cereus AH1134]